MCVNKYLTCQSFIQKKSMSRELSVTKYRRADIQLADATLSDFGSDYLALGQGAPRLPAMWTCSIEAMCPVTEGQVVLNVSRGQRNEECARMKALS